MPFNIVQTLEDGEQCLSVVPSGWEKDNILWWPKATGAAKLLREENSRPTSKWQRMECTRKREYCTRLEAEIELERMEAISDTEVEERVMFTAKKSRKNVPNLIVPKSMPKNFNEFLTPVDHNAQPGTLLNVSQSMQEEVQDSALPDGIFQNVEYLSPQEVQDPGEGPSGDHVLIQCVDKNCYQPVSLEDIFGNQTLIIDNQAKIINSLAHLKVRIDYINERVLQFESCSRGSIPTALSEDLFKPVNSVEMLNELERILNDDTVMAKYIKSMSHICGTMGKEDGIDCCYRLIDHFITRQFLTTCSWTGMTRDNAASGEPNGVFDPQMKIPFMTYKKSQQLFLKLVLLADNAFTTIKCDEFFKRVLKNSKQRLLSKTVSKHKNRPKNLQYNARQQEAGQTLQC